MARSVRVLHISDLHGRADVLETRGDLDEALRIRRETELPVHDRQGDVQSKAVTMGQIADILQAPRRPRRVLAHLPRRRVAGLRAPRGGRSLYVGLAKYAQMLLARPTGARNVEARAWLRRSVAIADRLGIPSTDELRDLLAELEQLPLA